MLISIFVFFIVFCFQINNLFISNIVFYALAVSLLAKNKLKIKAGKENAIFVLFMISIGISTIIFGLSEKKFDTSDMITFFFSLQYIVLVLQFDIPRRIIEEKFIICAVLLSIYVVICFFLTGSYLQIRVLLTTGRMWGEHLIPGWPNTTGLALLVALYFSFKNKNAVWIKLFYYVALFLTTSNCLS